MKITINIIKKHLFVFILLILISAGIFIAFAYNSDFKNKKYSSPAIFGHSADEVEVNINGENKTLQEALDFLTERINNSNSNGLTYLEHFSGLNINFYFPLKYIGEKNYKYIIIADVDGGQSKELLQFNIEGNLVVKEGSTIKGNYLPELGYGTKTRLRFNVNKDISSISFNYDCNDKVVCNYPPTIYDVWVYRVDGKQEAEQFSFPNVSFTFNIS